MATSLKFLHLKGKWVEEHDGDVRIKSGIGNITISCMRSSSGHNYRNSSIICGLDCG